MKDVTRILSAIEQGDPQAAEQLLPLVYDELRKLAALRLAHEKPGQTLQATALVHEAYLRLVDSDPARTWDGRGHFFAAAAEAMRRILVENARRKRTRKHGGDQRRADLDLDALVAPEPEMDLLALDAALDRLAAARSAEGPARRAALLRGADGRPGGRGPGDLPQQRRPAVDLHAGLAPPRAGPRRRALTHDFRGAAEIPDAGGAVSRIVRMETESSRLRGAS